MPDPAKTSHAQPPDQAERSRALDPARSFLVQAPAGSGKTYLLTQRFLRLLAQAEKPDEIVAITFTNAAAEEMRNRVLEALEKAEIESVQASAIPGLKSETWVTLDESESLAALARKAMERAHLLGWKILDQPSQLRITTIDAFCRGLALQSPLSWGMLSGLGGKLDAVENAKDLYRRAARRTLELLAGVDSPTRRSVEALLLWRDNNWRDVEELLVQMLGQRNRWYQEFVFAREGDWVALRARLEAPFCRGVRRRLEVLGRMLDGLSGSREFALELARGACASGGKSAPFSLAERAEIPISFTTVDGIEEAVLLDDAAGAYRDLACFLLTTKGEWRKKGGLNVNHGFPATLEGKAAKERFGELIEGLRQEPGLEAALAGFCEPMPVRYTEEEWELMRHCFAVLRVAFVELQTVFAETGSVDFIEVAQIALRILEPQNGFPSDLAMRQADSIRHLLIDEFQDTSRNQHQLLARLIAAWPEREGRSCFCVGDPMQSIYGFREAEVELFERTRTHGLEISDGLDAAPFRFEFVTLRANFRTTPSLVKDLNVHFERIFSEDDGSGVRFFPVEAARTSGALQTAAAKTELHLAFTRSTRGSAADSVLIGEPDETRREQLDEIVMLIRGKLPMIAEAQRNRETQSDKFRIAVLGRTKKSLALIAEALHAAGIGFRAIDLVRLRERPEVLDALSLIRALLNPVDRTAWLGVLRAPWCGLSLEELHLLTSADDKLIGDTPIPILLDGRLAELYEQKRLGARGFAAASRVGRVLRSAAETRAAAAGSALGTWIESVWKALGGDATVNAEQRQNLHLLWSALDALPEGELDLAGPGLDAALDELYALPDPASSDDFGVQLMTIHKSKGLEFEMVIVPDLEAEGRKGETTLISWLERGLVDSDDDQLTEFLIAPIQSKGSDPGVAKSWVDAVKRERERQELRRVLYVAATRAREELHLFVRPRYSVSKSDGAYTVAKPTGLLATAWPALGDAVETQFSAWVQEVQREQASSEQDETVETLAAEAGNLVEMPAPVKPTRLRRLPENYAAPDFPRRAISPTGSPSGSPTSYESPGIFDGMETQPLYARTEGGLRSRLEGTAVHRLLEQLSRLRQTMDPGDAARAVQETLPGIVAEIRSRGLPLPAAQKLAREALAVAQRSLMDPDGAWILTPHPEADAESRWTGMVRVGEIGKSEAQMQQRNLRPDRVFLAPYAGTSGPAVSHPVWWIIDYKTSHAAGVNLADEAERRAFLEAHREQHIDQLAAYGQVLRSLRGSGLGTAALEIRAGIYYPRIQQFDFWEA